MKLHTCFVTHDRLELTQQAIASYLETITVPYSYIVVDNASTDGTREWLEQSEHPHLLLDENRYPGFACNRGWEMAPPDATHLHRADNDWLFLPGWCQQVMGCFSARRTGQVGLRTNAEEELAEWNVGGNCVIRRELWERGLRWDERPWPELPPGYSEDSYFSPAIVNMGYRWRRVKRPCIEALASGDWEDQYYQKSYGDRRIQRPEES